MEKIAKLLRYYILTATTAAGTGHTSSSLSAVELMAELFFGGIFKFNFQDKDNVLNDRIIFSKGHAAPLLYSLYTVAGQLSEQELLTLRKFDSNIEGHPTHKFHFTEAATGSLGQGLSIGVGHALALKQKKEFAPRVYVLLGDSEMAEGQNWEALEIASYYKLNNLVGIMDVNRLGQRGETLLGWDLDTYKKRIEAFGWKVIIINDGHNFEEIRAAYSQIGNDNTAPLMIVAKTIKGKGVSIMEDKNGFHGKPLSEEQLVVALKELGEVDKSMMVTVALITGTITEKQDGQEKITRILESYSFEPPQYKVGSMVSTREAFGESLVWLGKRNENIVSLDAEMSNSTVAQLIAKEIPEQYFEMFIAEQNMISVGVGLNRYGYTPFLSTFASFLTRAHDQIRMASYNESKLCIIGSHCGLCANGDGISQMGLEDISMFRSVHGSVVLQPADAVSTTQLLECMSNYDGISYMRTSKTETKVLYSPNTKYKLGGSNIVRADKNAVCTICAVGVCLYEALAAADELQKEGIDVAVLDTYSIKPLDVETIISLAGKSKRVITVEDHYFEGGLGEAINSLLVGKGVEVINLAVKKIPKSGSVEKLMEFTEIDKAAIIKAVKKLLIWNRSPPSRG